MAATVAASSASISMRTRQAKTRHPSKAAETGRLPTASRTDACASSFFLSLGIVISKTVKGADGLLLEGVPLAAHRPIGASPPSARNGFAGSGPWGSSAPLHEGAPREEARPRASSLLTSRPCALPIQARTLIRVVHPARSNASLQASKPASRTHAGLKVLTSVAGDQNRLRKGRRLPCEAMTIVIAALAPRHSSSDEPGLKPFSKPSCKQAGKQASRQAGHICFSRSRNVFPENVARRHVEFHRCVSAPPLPSTGSRSGKGRWRIRAIASSEGTSRQMSHCCPDG